MMVEGTFGLTLPPPTESLCPIQGRLTITLGNLVCCQTTHSVNRTSELGLDALSLLRRNISWSQHLAAVAPRLIVTHYSSPVVTNNPKTLTGYSWTKNLDRLLLNQNLELVTPELKTLIWSPLYQNLELVTLEPRNSNWFNKIQNP